MTTTVIVSGARPPIAKFAGAYKTLSAVDLGAHAIREAMTRSGVSPDEIEYVIMGHVIQAGCSQNTARTSLLSFSRRARQALCPHSSWASRYPISAARSR